MTARSRPRVSVTRCRLRPRGALAQHSPGPAALAGQDGLGVQHPGQGAGVPALADARTWLRSAS